MPGLQRSSAAVCVLVVLTAAGTAHARDHDASPEAESTEEPSGVVGSIQAFEDVVPQAHGPSSAPAQSASSRPPPPPGSALPLPTWWPPNYAYPTEYQPLPPPVLDNAPNPAKERVGYGLHTLAVDGLALGLVVMAVTTESSAFGTLAAMSYVLGGPLVHNAHGQTGKAFGSLGIRVGAPVVGAGIGMALDDCDSGDGGCSGAMGGALGLILGFGAAIALDAAVLARKDAPAAPSKSVGAVRWVPRVTIEPRRATVGVDAVF